MKSMATSDSTQTRDGGKSKGLVQQAFHLCNHIVREIASLIGKHVYWDRCNGLEKGLGETLNVRSISPKSQLAAMSDMVNERQVSLWFSTIHL